MGGLVLVTEVGLGLVLLVVGGGTLLHLRRTRSGQATTATGVSEPVPADERLELVVRMAVLDERFAAGQVGRAEYEAVRNLTKRRLRQLTSTPGAFETEVHRGRRRDARRGVVDKRTR